LGVIVTKKMVIALLTLVMLMVFTVTTWAAFPWSQLQTDMVPMMAVSQQTLGNGVAPMFFYEPGRGLTLVQKVEAFTPGISFAVETLMERYTAYSTATIPLDEYITVVCLSTLDGSSMVVKMKNADIQAFANKEMTQTEIRRKTVFIYNGTPQ
jgi:hypothetical protein